MSCDNGKNIKHIWDFNGMSFVYSAKVIGNEEEMELLVNLAEKCNVSMIYTAETFDDCGSREIKSNVYGVWFQENDKNTNDKNIKKLWEDFKIERAILITGWHEQSGDC